MKDLTDRQIGSRNLRADRCEARLSWCSAFRYGRRVSAGRRPARRQIAIAGTGRPGSVMYRFAPVSTGFNRFKPLSTHLNPFQPTFKKNYERSIGLASNWRSEGWVMWLIVFEFEVNGRKVIQGAMAALGIIKAFNEVED
ncbi:MAG TPA: hypothetical protein VG347_20030, partial [Verrucomicrobiae bacterium]|nr:hypothetical protein [Verrucomicrobiae bacterium]